MATLIDLSQEIYQGMGVFTGHLKTVVFDHMTHDETLGTFESDLSYATKGIMLNDNGPTHVDSFSHLDPTGLSIAEMPLDLFYGPGVCVDVSHTGDNSYISEEEMQSALDASGQSLETGDTLLIHTGHVGRHHGTPEYLTKYPGLDAGAVRWIYENGAKVFGVDNPSPDNPLSTTYPVHVFCRDHKLTHYENLTNLDQLVGKRFTFIGFPLKVRGAHGGPTRAVALLDV